MQITAVDFDLTGGVAHAEMLNRSNILAIIGGGQAPKFPDRNGSIKMLMACISCSIWS